MTMASEKFNQQLEYFGIKLDQDSTDYICIILNEMDLTDHQEVRESTEAFLIDANINEKTRNTLYNALFSDQLFKANREIQETKIPIQLDNQKEANQSTKCLNSSMTTCSDSSKQSNSTTKRIGKRAMKKQQNDQENGDQEIDLVAISQQSRFHTETLETLSKDIDLSGVQISINQKDLLVDAHLRLKPCTRYGLVGQNGVGKSILMYCLADNVLVGLPQNLDILHVSQLEDFDEETVVVDEVLSADKKAMVAVREYEALRKVIDDTTVVNASSQDLNKVVFSILCSRIKDKVEEANRIAIKRSGLRGRNARIKLVKREQEYGEFCQKNPQEYVTADIANSVIAEVFEDFELIDKGERQNRAKKLLKGLGFSESQSMSPVSTFSGGWRMRIALAKSLFMQPDVLLLDEPTNHLDLPAILWLQEYLVNDTSDMIVVIVSHDREFLNNVTDETIIFKDKQLKYHAGNYQDWERNTEEQRIRKQNLLDNTEKKKKKILDSIQHNMQQAKATGDDKRHGMVNSRRKKLERLGMEKTEDGKRFKLNNRAGFHLTLREQIVVEKAVKTAAIKIPEPSPLRYNGPVFRMNEASFRYPGASENTIKSFSISIEPCSRIAFIGPNGCGKTTLLNMLTGKIQPTKGEVYHHNLLRIGYFSQHIVDQLDLDLTPVEYMMTKYPSLSEQDCRAYFGTVGMSGKHVLQKIRSLSGGQRNRVAFALILYERPHVLILDEITNHLDMGTVEVLVDALMNFSGALIVVSHDIWFLKQIMEPEVDSDSDEQEDEDIIQSEIYTIKKGQVQKWEKGIDAYVTSILNSVRKTKF